MHECINVFSMSKLLRHEKYVQRSEKDLQKLFSSTAV